MSKTWVAIIAGAGGVILGLLIADQYAKAKTAGVIHSALDSVGLGGGTVEQTLDAIIVPQVG